MTDFLAGAVASRPHAFAVDDGHRRWSFGELDRAVEERARTLRAAGAGPGRTIVLEADLSLEGLVSIHAVLRCEARLAPLHPRLTTGERADALQALRPALVLSGDGRGHVARGPGWADPALPADHRRAPSDPVAVLWTSGTSGQPRGVLLSELGLRASTEGTRRRLGLLPTDVWYASLLPSHVGGLALLVRAAILGCGLVLRGHFAVDEFRALLATGGITHASLVPTMLRRLLDADAGASAPSDLRCLLLGGAHTPGELVGRALAAGYPVALTYGLTEATSQVATAPPDLVRRGSRSVGTPLYGVEVRIGPHGGIHVRGPTVSPGLIGGGSLVDEDGWLHTNDLGHLDAEGHLHVVGRGSDRIISGGVNVDPQEVEAVLRRHPGVKDACVVGLPDETWGERVAALIVDDGAPGMVVSPSGALLDWVRGELSAAKRPRTILLVDQLPLNANGKVDRAAARDLLTPNR